MLTVAVPVLLGFVDVIGGVGRVGQPLYPVYEAAEGVVGELLRRFYVVGAVRGPDVAGLQKNRSKN